jgi:predicted RND superfamily exporter protein
MSSRFFSAILKLRWLVIAFWALLLIPSIYFAPQVVTDNALDRLIVPGNEGKIIFDDFVKTFGSDEFILVALESADIFSERYLATLDEMELKLKDVPYLATTRSLLSIYRQAHPFFNPHSESSREEFQQFAGKSDFFAEQGFIAKGKLMTIILQLKVKNSEQRREVVDALNQILAPYLQEQDKTPFSDIRVVGQPNMNVELDRSTVEIGAKFFPIYLLFAMGLMLFLYRSARGLLSILLTLAVCEAITIALVVVQGSMLTMVSGVLPMMVLIVAIETMVHLYSGYVRPPQGVERRAHLVSTLAQKWQACWFSVFTTAVGFGSFAVSPVMPIRDLGIFVAEALLIAFAASFTLFPVLLDIFKPSTGFKSGKSVGLTMFDPLFARIPTYSYWWRKLLVPGLTLLGLLSVYSFFQMDIETNSINYLDHDSKLFKDTMYVEQNLTGLMSMEVLVKGEPDQFSSPAALRKLQEFESSARKVDHVQAILSASTMLRMAAFFETGDDAYPSSNFKLSMYVGMLSQQADWSTYVSKDRDIYRISAMTKNVDYKVFEHLKDEFTSSWTDFVKANPEFEKTTLTITGMAPLTADITRHLLDTLLGSFGLTLLIVFAVFLAIIRRVWYSVLSMLPSIFAILFMYGVMTLAGIKLDIASIMIAAVVLGIGVDATIHFFQHYMEKLRQGSTVEQSLQYSLVITGRAIMVSTVVIFTGFMTFSFSSFPPLKYFGVFTSSAMIFSLIGTMIYLPACLWLSSPSQKPEHLKGYSGGFMLFPPKPDKPVVKIDEPHA